MKRHDGVWLIVRLTGLVFAAGALHAAMEFVDNILAVLAWDHAGAEGTLRLPNLTWDPAARAVLFGAVSLYLILRGKAMVALLMGEGTNGSAP